MKAESLTSHLFLPIALSRTGHWGGDQYSFAMARVAVTLSSAMCFNAIFALCLGLVAESPTKYLSNLLLKLNWHTFIFNHLRLSTEKAMAPHSSTLAWKIPWMEEPGRLWFMGSLRVGHDWATSLSLVTFLHWRRKWQPTPVFLPGESQGRGSLVGCRLWGRTESDTTELT